MHEYICLFQHQLPQHTHKIRCRSAQCLALSIPTMIWSCICLGMTCTKETTKVEMKTLQPNHNNWLAGWCIQTQPSQRCNETKPDVLKMPGQVMHQKQSHMYKPSEVHTHQTRVLQNPSPVGVPNWKGTRRFAHCACRRCIEYKRREMHAVAESKTVQRGASDSCIHFSIWPRDRNVVQTMSKTHV